MNILFASICRSNFCIFWLIHSDLHEPRFMHVSTMVASVQPIMQCTNQQTSPSNLLWLEKNSHKEKFHVRIKCHNGRAKLLPFAKGQNQCLFLAYLLYLGACRPSSSSL
ncbi:unnamed protein product [Musa textilis]